MTGDIVHLYNNFVTSVVDECPWKKEHSIIAFTSPKLGQINQITLIKKITYLDSRSRAAVAVSLGSLVVGYTSAWSSPAIASLQSDQSTISVTDSQASWIGSMMPLAALLGGLIGGVALEKFGRKTTILSTTLPFILAGVTVTIASSVSMICTGKNQQISHHYSLNLIKT